MKIGLAFIAQPDYLDKLTEQACTEARQSLQQQGVDIVSRDKPIVSQSQAVAASSYFLGEDVDGLILFLASWIECNVAMSFVCEMGHLPLLLWGFPMIAVDGVRQSTGSYVSFAMFKGVLDRIGCRYEQVLGAPADREAKTAVFRFCRVASARKALRRSRLGLVGYAAMSMYTGTFDHLLMRYLIGPEVVHIDSSTVIGLAQKMGGEEVERQVQWLRDISPLADDVADNDLQVAASVTRALLHLCETYELDGINVKCQPEFSREFGAVACVPVSSLAEFGVVGSCEGDMLCTVSMLLLHKLSGLPVSYGDCINHDGSVLTLSACGFMPYSFTGREQRLIRRFMPHPAFQGIQNSFTARPGFMTILRLIEDIGSYHMLIFTGQALADTKLRQGYMPAVDVAITGRMDDLVKAYNGQHYAFAYGDWSAELLSYCRMQGIRADLIGPSSG